MARQIMVMEKGTKEKSWLLWWEAAEREKGRKCLEERGVKSVREKKNLLALLGVLCCVLVSVYCKVYVYCALIRCYAYES